jgi:hypothetical protein
MVFNVAGTTWDWALYYAVTIGVEVLILGFILRSAWTWPRTPTVPARPVTTNVRQDLRQ